jgi:K+-sensing histidine kinase KdpD
MSQDMLEKIMRGEKVGTTKSYGYGIGMQQITGTIKSMEGQLLVRSKENKGTEFILNFKKVERPNHC